MFYIRQVVQDPKKFWMDVNEDVSVTGGEFVIIRFLVKGIMEMQLMTCLEDEIIGNSTVEKLENVLFKYVLIMGEKKNEESTLDFRVACNVMSHALSSKTSSVKINADTTTSCID
ncbi:hypothetical protein Tco_1293493 [Tanacetum coccineum]